MHYSFLFCVQVHLPPTPPCPRQSSGSVRTPDQSLVPESPHEAEKDSVSDENSG